MRRGEFNRIPGGTGTRQELWKGQDSMAGSPSTADGDFLDFFGSGGSPKASDRQISAPASAEPPDTGPSAHGSEQGPPHKKKKVPDNKFGGPKPAEHHEIERDWC